MRFLLECLLWTWLVSIVYFYDEEPVDDVWERKWRIGLFFCPVVGALIAWLLRV